MTSFYVLRPPQTSPAIPRRWSWSGLQSWRRCPRRWWLTWSQYDNAPTPYPNQVFVATVEGNLVHHALERFAAHMQQQDLASDYTALRPSFPVRSVVRDKLTSDLAALESNPRADRGRVQAKVSIDRCVNAFRAVAATYLKARSRSIAAGVHPEARRSSGAELQLIVSSPGLVGYLDWVTDDGEIFDFKTGEPDDTHAEQLQFYALLYWLTFRRRPSRLVLIYTATQTSVDAPVPDDAALRAMHDDLAAEIESIQAQLLAGSAPARPSVELCAFCPVRQLCTAYWHSEATAQLRLSPATIDNRKLGGSWLDVELITVPPLNRARSCVGEGVAAYGGAVDVSIGASHTAAAAVEPEGDLTQAWVLGAYVERREGRWSIAARANSEVFWQGADRSDLPED